MKKLYFLLFSLLLCSLSYGQTVASTSFEEPSTGGQYVDTGDANVAHDLINNAGQADVDYVPGGGATEIGFDASYVPFTTPDVGLTDGDFVGVTNFTGSVGAYTDGTQGYQFSDTDGIMILEFDAVDMTTYTNIQVSLDYFVNSTGWESADYIKIYVRDLTNVTETTILDTTGSDIDDLSIEGAWITGTAAGLSDNIMVQLVVEFASNSGSEALYLDNVLFVSSNSPTISAGGSVNNLNYVFDSGSPSDEGSFTVSGSSLTGDITITPPANFEISETSGSGFVDTNIILDGSSGTVATTTIYARLKANLGIGVYSADVTLTSPGADPQSVTLNGEVFSPPATLPFYEGFDYTVGQNLGDQSGWLDFNSGDNIVIAGPGGLTYTGLANNSQTGNHVSFDGSGAESKVEFETVDSGPVYASFLINLTDISGITDLADGGYIAALAGSDSGYDGRVWVRPNTDPVGTTYDISITSLSSAGGGAPFAGNYNVGETVLIVLSYNPTNGLVKGWVNPSQLGGTEPTPDFSETDSNPTSIVDRFVIRQDSNGETPFVLLDEIRIGNSYAEVTPLSLSTIESELNSFIMYPNPTNTGNVSITSNNGENMDVQVFDLLGKQVVNQRLRNNNLDVSHLISGLYIVKITQNNASVTKKLVIK